MSDENLEPWQLSHKRYQNRAARIEVVIAFGESEGSEWGEIVLALGVAAERMNGMCSEEDIETVLKIAEADIEAYKEQVEDEILDNDEYAVALYDHVNKILSENGLPAWEIEGFEREVGPCKDHPRYKAVQKPRVACEDCWAYYFKEHPEKQPV